MRSRWSYTFECKHVEMIVLGYRLVGEDGEICGGCRQLITVEKVKPMRHKKAAVGKCVGELPTAVISPFIKLLAMQAN